jgi:SAM-dependent methyltransferase
VVDVSKTAIESIQRRIPKFPSSQLIHGNFFDVEDGFDLIIEQTFFCALHPDLRQNYVVKMKQLLKAKGKLVGVMFNVPLNKDKPPFGGNKEAYLERFKPHFNIKIMDACYNSFGNRKGRELFVKLTKL